MKRCNICGVEKLETDFYKDNSRADGLELRCKQCSNTVRTKRMKNNSSLLKEYKTKCEKCGEDRLYLIDFHHINPVDKSFNIDSKYSQKKLLEEIKKCICLCKNCHAEFHHLYGKNPDNPQLALYEYLKR